MKKRWRVMLFWMSQLVFVALVGVLLLSFMPLPEGAVFGGRYWEVRTEMKPPSHAGFHKYVARKEYRGVFFREGVFAVGELVEDAMWEQMSEWRPKTGLRMMGEVARLPLWQTDMRWWNVLGVEMGRVDFVDPPPVGVFYCNRVRFNFAAVLVVEGAVLALMGVLAVRKRRMARRLAGWRISCRRISRC